MAQSLTEARRVAWRVQGIGPDPAHHLVVFKNLKGGKILHAVLRPGEVLRLPLFGSRDAYEAYAVSVDGKLRHDYNRKYQAVGQTWTFVLNVSLQIRVASAERLALSLLRGDPLQKLEDEAAAVLSATARLLPKEIMQREGEEFRLRLRDTETTDAQGECKANFRRLQDFAEELGLDLWNLEVTRTLDENVIRPGWVEEENERLVQIARSEQALEKEREKLAHETELLREQLKLERDVAVARGRQALEGMERLRMVLDGIATEGARAISQSVNGIRSFPALHDALIEIQNIQGSLAALSGGQVSQPALNGAVGAPPAPDALPAARPRASNPLERMVAQAFQYLRPLGGNPEDHNRILVSVLHLVAEAGLGRGADEEFLIASRDDLRVRLVPVRAALEREQTAFLDSILDIENLRRQFALEAS